MSQGSIVTADDIRRFKNDPLSLVCSGLMMVDSAYTIGPNGEYVRNPKGPQRVPFWPRWEQQQIIRTRYECNRRNRSTNLVIAKARDIGLSVVSSRIIAAEQLMSASGKALAVTLDPHVRRDVIWKMMKDAYQSLPVPLRPELLNNTQQYISYIYNCPAIDHYSDGHMSMVSEYLDESVGVGSRVSWLWISEYAKFRNASEIMRTVTDIMEDALTFRIKESTCEGTGNQHHQDFVTAWEQQGQCNPYQPAFDWDSGSTEIAMFFPWFHSPQRIAPLPAGVSASRMYNDLIEYERECYEKHLRPFAEMNRKRLMLHGSDDVMDHCMRQLYWKRCMTSSIKEFDFFNREVRPRALGSKASYPNIIAMRKECPTTLEEAFTDDAVKVFTDDAKRELRAMIDRPVRRGSLDDSGRFSEDGNGWLSTWFLPEELDMGFAPAWVYFIGVDVAHGDFPDDDKSDYSTISVWALRPAGLEQVAEVRIKEKVNRFQGRLELVLRFLSAGQARRTPFLCVECADAGRSIAQHYDDDQRYMEFPRLYYSQRAEVSGQTETTKPGFEPTMKALEREAWKLFEITLLEKTARIRSPYLLEEIGGLVRSSTTQTLRANNKSKGGPDSKDDLCDAAKMAMWHCSVALEDSGGLIQNYVPFLDDKLSFEPETRVEDLPKCHPDRIAAMQREQEERMSARFGIWSQLNS